MGAEILEQLVVVPDLIGTLARQADVAAKWSPAITSLMADDECRHGRLPSDPTPACGCWPGEASP